MKEITLAKAKQLILDGKIEFIYDMKVNKPNEIYRYRKGKREREVIFLVD